jgi:two-component system OmpR family response regulator
MSAQAVIVVVQDNPFVREMICDWLRRSGHVVHGVPGERAALRLLEQEAVDLVIVDLNVHRVDGLSMVRSVQSKLGAASLILTASTADYEDVAGALSPTIPIVAMGKPYSFYTLEQVVKAALVHGRLGSADGNDGLYAEGKCCGGAP